ncbi:uncharacterized protein LOC128669162 isoform X2 [Plodia interpunctella]|uniref:uncharacterized protein LOC128669162 isoform X2 n=1 Tax=Plodia interpunctella TaxID=58824 RepID=UPI00236898A8|nr:uncharacterized protein LOC128669162 isoform X2 [Plodia interpunctella]
MQLLPLIDSVKNTGVMKVSAGDTATLQCISNDYNHNFMFWVLGDRKVIGPTNDHDYDKNKYKYEVLSGNLKIHAVTPAESGFYQCFSKNINSDGVTIGQVEMLVNGSGFTAMDAVKLVAIVCSIIIIIACAVIFFRLRKERSKYDGRSIVPDDNDEDADGEEIYNRTTTTITQPQPVAGPSRNPSSEQLLYGIDNQGLDTDFNSVFENIQIKTPQGSLI